MISNVWTATKHKHQRSNLPVDRCRSVFVRCPTIPPARRQGFTLFELLLVLTVIVTIAALSWPQLLRYVRQQNVQHGADQVRQLLDKARVSAVEEGLTYQFRYEPYGRKFVLLPFDLLTDPENPNEPQNTAANSDNTELAQVYELAETCSFYVPNSLTGEPQPAERLSQEWLKFVDNGSAHADVSWSPPILYYSDGSAVDARVTVQDTQRNYVSVFVRSLTGGVTTSKVAVLPEMFGG